MAYIRVPTGIKNYTVTVTSPRFIMYRCFKCKEMNIHEFEISAQATKQYHVFHSKETKEFVKEETAQEAVKLLEQRDRAFFLSINTNAIYNDIDFEVKCPDCGAVQPWSDMRGPLRKRRRLKELKEAVFEPPVYVSPQHLEECSDETDLDNVEETREQYTPSPDVTYCRECGQTIPVIARFCPYCGTVHDPLRK